jgi:hypothetical protein
VVCTLPGVAVDTAGLVVVPSVVPLAARALPAVASASIAAKLKVIFMGGSPNRAIGTPETPKAIPAHAKENKFRFLTDRSGDRVLNEG